MVGGLGWSDLAFINHNDNNASLLVGALSLYSCSVSEGMVGGLGWSDIALVVGFSNTGTNTALCCQSGVFLWVIFQKITILRVRAEKFSFSKNHRDLKN